MTPTIRPEAVTAVNAFLAEFHFAINLFFGFAILTSMLVLIINIMNLGVPGSGTKANEKKKSGAMSGILISGVCIAVLGSLATWYTLFYTSILM